MIDPGEALPPAMFDSAAFHDALAKAWFEDPDRPGSGRLATGAAGSLSIAWDRAADRRARDRHAWVFLIGLLLEADGPAERSAEVAASCAARVPDLLSWLTDAAGSDGGDRLVNAILYVLAQVSAHGEAIVEAVGRALGSDSGAAQALRALSSGTESAQWNRAVIAYLGAEAAAAVPADRLDFARSVLACPACRGELIFDEARPGIDCPGCAATYGFEGDVPHLVTASDGPRSEFTPELVARYESRTRPRFVRAMSGDFSGGVGPEREARYLEANLRTLPGPVLDLGCGAGGWTDLVARQVGVDRVVAIDYSGAMMQACVRKLPRVLGVCGDAGRLPIRDAVLGGANCSDALQAFPDPAAALAEVARCLKPGAPFTAFTFLRDTSHYGYFQHRVPLHPRWLFDADELRATIVEVGLEIVDWGQERQALFFTARRTTRSM